MQSKDALVIQNDILQDGFCAWKAIKGRPCHAELHSAEWIQLVCNPSYYHYHHHSYYQHYCFNYGLTHIKWGTSGAQTQKKHMHTHTSLIPKTRAPSLAKNGPPTREGGGGGGGGGVR